MKMSADRVVRAVPGMIRSILSVGCLTLLSCSTGDNKPESPGTATSPIIALDPSATVVAGEPSTRSATCPGHELPDQCGSWAGVELHATRTPDPRHGFHHHECRHHGHGHHADVTTDDDEHCLCEPVDFVIPSELPVTAGQSGGEGDKAELSFRTASGKFVECEYRGNFEDRHGHHPASGGDKYVFQHCDRGFKAGQATQSDWFQLKLDDGHGSKTNVEVSLRLGEPDVVGGVVQEQIFYADDARVPGAALHVPRGSAPDFESFSLDVVPQVRPGTPIENGGDPVTAVGYAVDVHSDSTDNFVFTPVPGSCPRIELPYDAARLAALLGPGHESSLNASHLTSVAAIAGGGHVLEPLDPVTVDLANHTLSFCAEHLSIYLTNTTVNSATVQLAQLFDGSTLVATLVDRATPANEATSLPTLVGGKSYSLTLTFNNNGNVSWGNSFKLVVVGAPSTATPPTVAELAANAPAWVTWRTCGIEQNCDTGTVPAGRDGTVAATNTTDDDDMGTFTMTVRAPATPAPMNFCLRSGAAAYFGECFSWDPHFYTGGGGQLPPSVCVPSTEVCNHQDDDCDGFIDEGLTRTFYADADGDGYGNSNAPKDDCSAPSGYVADASDCDDTNAGIHPATYYPDCDGDGYGKDEICVQPQAESTPFITVPPVSGCIARPAPMSVDYAGTTIVVNYVTSNDDCDNYSASTHPGAPELCDYRDNNCVDGTNDEAHTVSYRFDNDSDGWCQSGSIMGCAGFAPFGAMREASQCTVLTTPPFFVIDDCNDANYVANTFCGEYLHDISDTFSVGGGLFGDVETRSFHVDCGPGWHVSRCNATQTSNDGDIGISSCPVGNVAGDVVIRFGIGAFLSVSGYGTAYCSADDRYPDF